MRVKELYSEFYSEFVATDRASDIFGNIVRIPQLNVLKMLLFMLFQINDLGIKAKTKKRFSL